MSLTRVSEENLNKRRDEVTRLKLEIRDHELLASQKESDLWKRLGPGIKDSIEANRFKLEELLENGGSNSDAMFDFGNAKLLAGAIRAYKNILQEVEVDAVIERKRDRVGKLTEEIKKIVDEQGI